MPKGNPGRLKDRFEIRGELVPNEYEYQRLHGEMTEREHENFPPAEEQGDVPEAGTSPQQRRAARIAEIEARAHEIVERRRAKRDKSAQSGTSKGGARKSAKKSASKRRSTAKKGQAASKGRAVGGAKKSAATRGAKKSSAKKSGRSKSAGKSTKAGARKRAAKRR